jgi:hypothetical protein
MVLVHYIQRTINSTTKGIEVDTKIVRIMSLKYTENHKIHIHSEKQRCRTQVKKGNIISKARFL